MTTIERIYGARPDVLLVEDDPRQCAEFEDFFKRIHASYEIVNDGETAIQRLESVSPAVVLLDIRLPRASGIEVAKAILRQRRRPVVVLMSGHIESVFEANQSPARSFRILEKPIDLRALGRFIAEVKASVSPSARN